MHSRPPGSAPSSGGRATGFLERGDSLSAAEAAAGGLVGGVRLGKAARRRAWRGRKLRMSGIAAHMGHKSRTADEEIAAVAAGAHGVVTRAQLLRARLTEKQIVRRLARGSLIRVHRGVYRVGHMAPSVEADYLAAVRAGG